MSLCPHCVAGAAIAVGVSLPFIPTAWRAFKAKFQRQTFTVEHAKKMYDAGYKSTHADKDTDNGTT